MYNIAFISQVTFYLFSIAACSNGIGLVKVPDSTSDTLSSGLYMSLPKSRFEVTIRVSEERFVAGHLEKYAKDYGLKSRRPSMQAEAAKCSNDASGNDEIRHKFIAVEVSQIALPDRQQTYVMSHPGLIKSGGISATAINGLPMLGMPLPSPRKIVSGVLGTTNRGQIDLSKGAVSTRAVADDSRWIASPGSIEVKARAAIDKLADLERVRLNLISSTARATTGRVDPQTLALQLQELENEEHEIVRQFVGTTNMVTFDISKVFEPSEVPQVEIFTLGKFSICTGWGSTQKGTVADAQAIMKDDVYARLSPSPDSLAIAAAAVRLEAIEKNADKVGLVYRFPVISDLTVWHGERLLVASEVKVPQKGATIRLSEHMDVSSAGAIPMYIDPFTGELNQMKATKP